MSRGLLEEAFDADRDGPRSLARLLPRVRAALGVDAEAPAGWADFERRLGTQWPRLLAGMHQLYGRRYDFFLHLEVLLTEMATAWLARPEALCALDRRREHDAGWYEDRDLVGGALYVDLFSENLGKLREHIPYFQELGLTYLHLMPLFAVRPGDSDGGYAVSNYRSVNPKLGTMEDLVALAQALRAAGISLVLDFIFNHTADDHPWAQAAQAGDPRYQDFYYLFEDREVPDRLEAHLREIFPTVRRGSFTWHEGMRRWVWTTFNSFQWDLRYANPEVFTAMASEMLYLANTGVEVLRLDAVAFIWKQAGTACENLPEAHTIIQCFNAIARVAAPALVFKSEAIVHPDEVLTYIGEDECQLSYNPLLMALLWESLATRQVALLERSMVRRQALPPGCMWTNYLRCHDDIGWTFDDADAAALGMDAWQHRRFLNEFYTGQFPGSFARGIPFQHNPDTGDMRISGTLASLAGLEQAVERDDPELMEMALRRVTLLNSVICSIGGVPLIYLGEEWGVLNDYDYVKDPAKAGDSRWVHRPRMRWEYLTHLDPDRSVQHRLHRELKKLIALRKQLPALTGSQVDILPAAAPSVLAYLRKREGARLIVLANFSESPQQVDGNLLRTHGPGRFFTDLWSGESVATSAPVAMGPYAFRWLTRD